MSSTDALTSAPIILDAGTGTTRAGFAGADAPKIFFPTLVGRPKHTKVLASGPSSDEVFVGDKAAEMRGLCRLSWPMRGGVVRDWGDWERVVECVWRGLGVGAEMHPLLLTEAPLNPRSNRATAAQILFETFNIPALYTSIQAVLSLYASGRTTGLVLDSGDGVSHTVPVYEGFAIPNSIQRTDLAGRDVTEELQRLLRKSGYVFETSAEKEVVRCIKEKVSYLAVEPRKEERAWAARSGEEDGRMRQGGEGEGREGEAMGRPTEYVLPDGHRLKINQDRFRAPEILFTPSQIGLESPGLHTLVTTAIARTDLDLRAGLYSSIVLSGGTTLTKRFGDRLLYELKRSVAAGDSEGVKVRILAPPERKWTTWIGGSILGGLSSFKKMWVTAEEYQENPDIIFQKFS